MRILFTDINNIFYLSKVRQVFVAFVNWHFASAGRQHDTYYRQKAVAMVLTSLHLCYGIKHKASITHVAEEISCILNPEPSFDGDKTGRRKIQKAEKAPIGG